MHPKKKAGTTGGRSEPAKKRIATAHLLEYDAGEARNAAATAMERMEKGPKTNSKIVSVAQAPEKLRWSALPNLSPLPQCVPVPNKKWLYEPYSSKTNRHAFLRVPLSVIKNSPAPPQLPLKKDNKVKEE